MDWRGESACGSNDSNTGCGQPARDQRGLFDQRTAQRRLVRQYHLGTAAQCRDHRHWRDMRAGAARAGQLAVSDDRQLPSTRAIGCRGDEFGDRGQRTQSLTTPEHLHGIRRQVP
jgi:hypothetical protein